jgi:hypothetical protein
MYTVGLQCIVNPGECVRSKGTSKKSKIAKLHPAKKKHPAKKRHAYEKSARWHSMSMGCLDYRIGCIYISAIT